MTYTQYQGAVKRGNLTRWVLITVSALFAVAMSLGIFSQTQAAPGPKLKTTGGMTAAAGAAEIQVNMNAFGEHPKKGVFGNFSYANNTAGISFEGDVNQCYEQTGNVAVFVGEVTDANGFATDQEFRVAVQDNSAGGSGDPDRARVQLGENLECGNETNFPAVRTAGNLTVH